MRLQPARRRRISDLAAQPVLFLPDVVATEAERRAKGGFGLGEIADLGIGRPARSGAAQSLSRGAPLKRMFGVDIGPVPLAFPPGAY